MTTGSFAAYLTSLDSTALTELLRRRPDVRLEPVPRGMEQLAQRLNGPDSLVAALRSVDRDTVAVGEGIAALGSAATLEALARLFDTSVTVIRTVVDELCRHGLAWLASASEVRLPERLAMHWSAEMTSGRPATTIARTVLADDLRTAVDALGIETAGLRKNELVTRLGEAMADLRAITTIVCDLPTSARDLLEQLRTGYSEFYPGYLGHGPSNGATMRALAEAGLVLRVNHRWEMPREVGVAAWLAEQDLQLTGPPTIPPAQTDAAAVLATGQAAIQDLLRAATSLLDDAGSNAIAALKKGGVGPRERTRLGARLSLPDDILLLVIDLTYAAELLGETETGYAPTERYASWRAAGPAAQWSALVTAWFALEHAPTSRETFADKQLPPPLPLASGAGGLRRALLKESSGGRSVHAVADRIGWFHPLHGYDEPQLREKVAAALREGELLGVVAADVRTEYGDHLLATIDSEADDDELARRVARLLPEMSCTVILQSDLTAVVSGQPTVAVSRVLSASSVSETRGTAGVWRFSPASVREALDAGWTSTELLAELASIADKPVPQPLEYLITDVARRHGQVRVRGMRSCVLADEPMITEILHTRSLAKLHLAALAPTVLSSPCELTEVLARLRAAGLSPVAEDTKGVAIVETRQEHRATPPARPIQLASRVRLTAEELAERLLDDPAGKSVPDPESDTFDQLADLNPDLDDAELLLLADAVDNQHDILITYRSKTGSRTTRAIQPRQLYGRWLDSWCRLRDAQRDFTVANIESVAPAG